jgi:hypothetical protein
MSSFQQMPVLFPPEYPDRPDMPLLSFGPSFSEEIARSVISAIWHEFDEEAQETSVRVAAALTMLEAFHPRDQVECMLAAQAVASHSMIMDLHRRIMHADMTELVAIKLRGNIAQISRTFSGTLSDLDRRQARPLVERPPSAPPMAGPPFGDPPRDGPPGAGTLLKDPRKITSTSACFVALVDAAEEPEDLKIRPDGTPGSLAAYAPKPPVEEFVPREPAIMWALATRPKPWKMVNAPSDQPTDGSNDNEASQSNAPGISVTVPASRGGRGPIDLNEQMFIGDALSRFASARLDPDAPVELPNFDDEDSVVELEMISAGDDPEMEAERRAMMAAHPEGKPIRTYRYGGVAPPPDKPSDSK